MKPIAIPLCVALLSALILSACPDNNAGPDEVDTRPPPMAPPAMDVKGLPPPPPPPTFNEVTGEEGPLVPRCPPPAALLPGSSVCVMPQGGGQMMMFCAPGYVGADNSPIKGNSFITPPGADPKQFQLVCVPASTYQ